MRDEECRHAGAVLLVLVVMVLTVMVIDVFLGPSRKAELAGELAGAGRWQKEALLALELKPELQFEILAAAILRTIFEMTATELEFATAAAKSGISGSKFLG